jgi:hypothetical protein
MIKRSSQVLVVWFLLWDLLLTAAGWIGAVNLPALSDELYRTARRLRVFVARPVRLTESDLLRLVEQSAPNRSAAAD